MPFPNAHLRVSWFGDGWAQQEEWSTGLRLDSTAMPSDAQMQALDAAFGALFTNPNLAITSSVRYLGLKVAPQDVNGRYPADAQSKEFLRATPLQTNGAGGLPQATLAATLTTATPRGLANEGRMYLPATVIQPAADGRVSTGIAEDYMEAVITFINAVNDVGVGLVTVFSAGTPKTPVGAKREVTGVRVGRVVDTQRRRRNSIAELYVSAGLGN